MPTSNYSGFEVGYDREDGTQPVAFASQVIHVRDVTNSADLSDISANAGGTVAAGTLPVAVGTSIRFYYSITSGIYKGVCCFKEVITT